MSPTTSEWEKALCVMPMGGLRLTSGSRSIQNKFVGMLSGGRDRGRGCGRDNNGAVKGANVMAGAVEDTERKVWWAHEGRGEGAMSASGHCWDWNFVGHHGMVEMGRSHIGWEWHGKQEPVCLWWGILHFSRGWKRRYGTLYLKKSLFMGHNLIKIGITLLWHRPVLPCMLILYYGGHPEFNTRWELSKKGCLLSPPFDRHVQHTRLYVKGLLKSLLSKALGYMVLWAKLILKI